MNIMAKEKENKEKKTYKQFRIGSTEQIKNTLQRLINSAGNQTLPESTIRLMNEIIKTRLALQKNIDLENEIQELKDIVYGEKEQIEVEEDDDIDE